MDKVQKHICGHVTLTDIWILLDRNYMWNNAVSKSVHQGVERCPSCCATASIHPPSARSVCSHSPKVKIMRPVQTIFIWTLFACFMQWTIRRAFGCIHRLGCFEWTFWNRVPVVGQASLRFRIQSGLTDGSVLATLRSSVEIETSRSSLSSQQRHQKSQIVWTWPH